MKYDPKSLDVLPLTPAQSGMLFHVLDDPAATPYVAVLSCALDGPLDKGKLRNAMQAAIQARDAFRASFVWDGVKQPVQVIREKIELTWTEHDWSSRPEDKAQDDLQNLIALEQTRQFDLASAPLMQVHLIAHSQTRHTLVWTIHHIISDGWSTGVVLRDVILRYLDQIPANAAQTSFKDYVIWLRKSGRETPNETFWSAHLADAEPSKLDLAPLAEPDFGHGHLKQSLGADLHEKVKLFCRIARVTPNSFLAAAWAILLRHLQSSNDVIFGQTSAGRPVELPGSENAAGAFINTLPLRLKIDPDESVATFVANVEATQRTWRDHEFAALPKVQSLSKIPNGTALFDTLFVSEALAPMDLPPSDLKLNDLQIVQSSNYALALLVAPIGDFQTELYFDRQLVAEDTAQEVLSRYAKLVSALIGAPDESVRAVVAKALQAEAKELPASTYTHSILSQFLEQVERNPDALAVSDGAQSLSYAGLAQRAAGIAALLKKAGVTHGELIPVALDRSVDSLASFLGVWMAGAAYVPLDLTYPGERIRQIIKEVAPKHVITRDGVVDPDIFGAADLIFTDNIEAKDPNEWKDPEASQTAYVVFTSGSEGKPKGVVISHGALSHSTGVREEIYEQAPDAYLVLSSLAFDSSVPGLFWPLTCGGHMVLAPRRVEQDPPAFSKLIAKHHITHCLCLPSLAQAILPASNPDDLKSLQTLIAAGEPLSAQLCDTVASHLPDAKLFNEYGPTEATVWATAFDATGHQDSKVPIGTALPGTDVHVCDRDAVPLPRGFNGEVFIAGPTLADGYHNNTALTESSFPKASYGSRVYRTKDLGYVATDGEIHLLGRADAQMKIRGHRIEPQDIERVGQEIFGSARCAAFLKNAELCLAIESAGSTLDNPSAAFANRLPAAWVPKHFVFVEELPRLPNGKVDHNALQQLKTDAPSITTHQQELTDLERQLTGIFKQVLNIENVPLDGNFFDLGGDSLATITAYSLARKNGLNFAPTDLFETPDIASLSRRILKRSVEHIPHESTLKTLHTNAGAEKAAVLLLHGTISLFNAVSRGLGEKHAVGLAFSDYLHGSETALHKTVEDYADDVIADLRTLRPTGPYVICAYSAGAVVALEAARRLDEEIVRIVMIDPPYQVLGSKPESATSERARADQARIKAKLRNRCLRHGLRVALLKTIAPVLPKSEWRRRKLVQSAYVFALSKYRIKPHDGPVVIITTSDNPAMKPEGTLDTHLTQKSVETLSMRHLDVISTPEGVVAVSSRIVSSVKNL